ncbi:hypothetical protein GH733_018200, partial [Mirounga leonina]
MAHDLTMWFLPALENTKTGVLSVASGLKTAITHSGPWLLEVSSLDMVAMVAKWALKALWTFCSSDMRLLRNVNTQLGHWGGKLLPWAEVLVKVAIRLHTLYYAVKKRYGALPKKVKWCLRVSDVLFYLLRLELAESSYLLYQAAKNPKNAFMSERMFCRTWESAQKSR